MHKGIISPASPISHKGGKGGSMAKGTRVSSGIKSSTKGMVHSPAKTMHVGRKRGAY